METARRRWIDTSGTGNLKGAFLLCLFALVIAALDLGAAWLSSPSSDMVPGSVAFFYLPITLLGSAIALRALREIRRSPAPARGRGLAISSLGMTALAVLLALLFDPVQHSARARKSVFRRQVAALASVRSINTAEAAYQQTYPSLGFTCSLAELAGSGGSSTAAGLIDAILASGVKSGYVFSLSQCEGKPRKSYRLVAAPQGTEMAGARAFCSDQTGVIRFSADGNGDHCLQSGAALQ